MKSKEPAFAVGGMLGPGGEFMLYEVSLKCGTAFAEFVRFIETEKARIHRESGQPARFLLVGRNRYQRIVGEFCASGASCYVTSSVDELGALDSVLGLTIVIDPTREHRIEVIGMTRWEASR